MLRNSSRRTRGFYFLFPDKMDVLCSFPRLVSILLYIFFYKRLRIFLFSRFRISFSSRDETDVSAPLYARLFFNFYFNIFASSCLFFLFFPSLSFSSLLFLSFLHGARRRVIQIGKRKKSSRRSTKARRARRVNKSRDGQ